MEQPMSDTANLDTSHASGQAAQSDALFYIEQAIEGFAADPADTPFQRGYLAALLTVYREGFGASDGKHLTAMDRQVANRAGEGGGMVIAADRIQAAEVLGMYESMAARQRCLNGDLDMHPVTEAFARHRAA
jgi:hypothetical protein